MTASQAARPTRTAPALTSGTVYACTTLHVPLPGHQAPYTLAYVDLDGGGRVLSAVDRPVVVGERVVLLPDPASPAGVTASPERAA